MPSGVSIINRQEMTDTGRDGARDPRALLVGQQTGAATVGSHVWVPRNVNDQTSLQPSNSTSGYLREGNKTWIEKTCAPQVQSSIVYSGRATATTQMNRGCVYTGILFSHRPPKETLPLATTGTGRAGVALGEGGQARAAQAQTTWVSCWVCQAEGDETTQAHTRKM